MICPACNVKLSTQTLEVVMEKKFSFSLQNETFNPPISSGTIRTVYQCPDCKNIEVADE